MWARAASRSCRRLQNSTKSTIYCPRTSTPPMFDADKSGCGSSSAYVGGPQDSGAVSFNRSTGFENRSLFKSASAINDFSGSPAEFTIAMHWRAGELGFQAAFSVPPMLGVLTSRLRGPIHVVRPLWVKSPRLRAESSVRSLEPVRLNRVA